MIMVAVSKHLPGTLFWFEIGIGFRYGNYFDFIISVTNIEVLSDYCNKPSARLDALIWINICDDRILKQG
jgi:hypothetical protein